MFRIAVAMIIGGAIFTYFGAREFALDRRASPEPVAVKLAELESGNAPENPHVKIGEHIAVYSIGVYEYRGESGTPISAITPITEYYYPLISQDHPFIQELAALAAKHGGIENVPDSVPWPEINSFRVLVKTKRFGTIGEIPEEMDKVDSLQGLIINTVDPLDKETKDLLRQQFPGVDLDHVLIVEDGRKPNALAWGLAKVLGPAAVCVLGVFLIIPRRSAKIPEIETNTLESSNPYAAIARATTDSPNQPEGDESSDP